jgi:hypothetical protein
MYVQTMRTVPAAQGDKPDRLRDVLGSSLRDKRYRKPMLIAGVIKRVKSIPIMAIGTAQKPASRKTQPTALLKSLHSAGSISVIDS